MAFINGIDDDGDGKIDEDPDGYDTDGDGLFDGGDPDPLFSDADLDGLSMYEEIVLGTDPNDWDSDGDGINDYMDPSEDEDNGPPFVALAPEYINVDHRYEIYLVVKDKSPVDFYFPGDTNTDDPCGVDVTGDGIKDFDIRAGNAIGEMLYDSELSVTPMGNDVYRLQWDVYGFNLNYMDCYQIAIVDSNYNYVVVTVGVGGDEFHSETDGLQSITPVDQQQYKVMMVSTLPFVGGATAYPSELYCPWPTISYEITSTATELAYSVAYGAVAAIFVIVAIAEIPPETQGTISWFEVDTIGTTVSYYPSIVDSWWTNTGDIYLLSGTVDEIYEGDIRGYGWEYIHTQYPEITVDMIDEAVHEGETIYDSPEFKIIDYYNPDWGFGLEVYVSNDIIVDINKFEKIRDYAGRDIVYDPNHRHINPHKYPTRPDEIPITDEIIREVLEDPDEVWYDNDGWRAYIKLINGHWYIVFVKDGTVVTGYNPDEKTMENERKYIDRALKKTDKSTGEPMKKEYPSSN